MEKDLARIRFNLSTGELEIQGTEAFVETYFSKIKALLEKPAVLSTPGRKKTTKKRTPPIIRESSEATPPRKDTKTETLLTILREMPEGLNTKDLMERTGFTDRQVRTIIYRAEKQGLIRKLRRGIYLAA